MKTATHFGAALALLACLASGCQLFPRSHVALKGHSPLQPAQASPDSVAMNIVWARFSANDPIRDDATWREIDEAQIEPAIRRELLNNGFRAGVISGAMPPAIAKIMRQDERPAAPPVVGDPKAPATVQSAELLNDPVVHGRTKQMSRKLRVEVPASEVYGSLPLLVSGGSELGGHTYEQAQAIYALRVDPQPDHSTLVELTPELHHGAARLRYSGEEGIVRQVMGKDREVYDRLRFSVKLAPGEMLVLMSLPDAGSRLGHYFHTVDSSDGLQQKLILIRLAEVPPSDTFANTANR
jgi:hypothetical protein